jgi:dihydropteroate synthase
LVGISRKPIACRTPNVSPAEAFNGAAALNMPALAKGVDILRVHGVKGAVEAVKLPEATKQRPGQLLRGRKIDSKSIVESVLFIFFFETVAKV